MPDLDRTTLLEAIEICTCNGAYQSLTELQVLLAALPVAPSEAPAVLNPHVQTFDTPQPATVLTVSEAPAEAFTAKFTAEEIDAQAEYHAEISMHYEPQTVSMLNELARLVRERRTGKG